MQTLPNCKTRSGLNALHLRRSSPSDMITGHYIDPGNNMRKNMWCSDGSINGQDGEPHPLDLILEVHTVSRGSSVRNSSGEAGVVVARDQHGVEAFVKFDSGPRWVPQTSLVRL